MGTELQSSESPRVTTETTIGCPCGEYSKHNLPHTSSATRTCKAPASKVDSNSTVTCALSVKFSSVAANNAAGALSVLLSPAGEKNQSVLAPAEIRSSPSGSLLHSLGEFTNSSSPGIIGIEKLMTALPSCQASLKNCYDD